LARAIADNTRLIAENKEVHRLRARITELQVNPASPKRSIAEKPRSTKPVNEWDEERDRPIADAAIPTMDAAVCLSSALFNYASRNDFQLPQDLSLLADYLPRELDSEKKARALAATNVFELVYTGSVSSSTNFPQQRIKADELGILFRQREPWPTG